MLLYTPAVRTDDFAVAISYLFRRLEENASDDNFLRHLFDLEPGSASFVLQESIFRQSLAQRHGVGDGPSRTQDRRSSLVRPYEPGQPFVNQPETDPTLLSNRDWIAKVVDTHPSPVSTPMTTTIGELDGFLHTARSAQPEWGQTPLEERQEILHRVADELTRRWGELASTMVHEANKTFREADGEIAEAIDFARWYGDRASQLDQHRGLRFQPIGVVAVIPPWNFPVAIPAGGVLSGLAAGNSVILKPAPETPRCAEIIAETCWAAGVPPEVMQFVRVPDNEVGRHLVVEADAVILTGSTETADLFRSWKPDLRLFAETSGKNALIITPSADIDLAVADLMRSAFGHSGQKCSAASLAVLVGDVYDSPRFRRQLIDAVQSLQVGPATEIATMMGPLIGEQPNDRLARGLSVLDAGERWLVEPWQLEPGLWSPGVRDGVTTGSWYANNECFGPVLGLMRASDLDDALATVNASDFGLTGGIHTLDPTEIAEWTERVEVGNAYINRHITGAIVQRQPFGGWKRSSVGPGAKAGGVNYVAQLGDWISESSSDDGSDDYAEAWSDHFAVERDETGLFCESNVFRYRSLPAAGLRIGPDAQPLDVERVCKAAALAGNTLIESHHTTETQIEFAQRLDELGVERVRMLGETATIDLHEAANHAGVHLATEPVTAVGRIELLHYLREQSVSRTLHRFGNLVQT